MTLLRPFNGVFSQASSSLTQRASTSTDMSAMATDGFESLAGLRKQIIENCCFFAITPGDISLIITREPTGAYKAIVLSESSRRRDVLLSSDSFNTVTKALEHVFIKSTDAVQQYITANDFRRLPSVVDNDDDGVSSVSSSVDEPDKDRLADSSLSLESELESAYESLSEDGDGIISRSRARTGGRPRSYDVRTARRDSRSRSRSRERAPTYRRAPAPPSSRYLLHNMPVHRSRAVDPPRPYAGPTGGNDTGNVRCPALPTRYSDRQPHLIPPLPEHGFMAHGVNASGPSAPRLGPDARTNAASLAMYHQQLGAIRQHQLDAAQQQRELNKRGFEQGQRTSAELLNLDGKAVSQPSLPSPDIIVPPPSGHQCQPGPWTQLNPSNDPRPYLTPPITNQMPWSLSPQRFQSMPHQQPLPPQKPPIKTMHQMMRVPSPPPVMHSSSSASSIASSSASSTPTVTASISTSTPPDYSSVWTVPASIDYRLAIKIDLRPTLDTMAEDRLVDAGAHVHAHAREPPQPQEYRILARTPPTRSQMSAVALRFVQQNVALFPATKNVPKGGLRALVTRVVFRSGTGGKNGGQSREESYDLTVYAETDFSKLCESMKRARDDGEDKGGLPQWPLFEVIVCNPEPRD